MAEIIVFLSVVILIAIMLYISKNLDPSLNFMKWFLILMIIPMMTALASLSVDYGKDCALIYNDSTTTLTKVCTGTVSNISLWLLKITTFLMYVEAILMGIGLLIMGYNAITKNGAYFK